MAARNGGRPLVFSHHHPISLYHGDETFIRVTLFLFLFFLQLR